MNLNEPRSSLLRHLDPKSAPGRFALQQLTQQEIDILREKFPKSSGLTEWFSAILGWYSALFTAFLLVLLVWSLLGNAAAILFPHIEPGDHHLIGVIFSRLFWVGFVSSGVVLSICIHLGKGFRITKLIRKVEEHKHALEALGLAQNHQGAAEYMEIVAARREFVSADADALMAIANEDGMKFARAEEEKKQKNLQQILQQVQNRRMTSSPDQSASS